MLRSSFLSFLAIGLLAIGCASKKPTNSPNGLSGDDSVGANSPGSLELRGDSDTGSAGGLQSVYFAFDSAGLDADAKSTLKNNSEFLKSNSSVEVQVEGHCDERGGIQYNLALGERRAKAVRDYMVALGVASKRLSVISYGKEKPVAFGHDESAWGKNRRANFVVTAK